MSDELTVIITVVCTVTNVAIIIYASLLTEKTRRIKNKINYKLIHKALTNKEL